jgi:predicted permease
MIRNYLKVAFRNIIRHKAFSLLNIFGLSVGIAACLLLFMVVRYEMSYDRFLPGSDKIHRIVIKDVNIDGEEYGSGIPYPALDALRLDMPDLTVGALFSSNGSQVTVLGKDANGTVGKKFIEDSGVFFADPELFKVFKYTWMVGSPDVLNQPDVTVLTQELATKYFGSWQDAVGQYVRLDNALNLKVAGILKDVPANTDFPLAIVTSFITSKNNPTLFGYNTDWGSTTSNFQLYAGLSDAMTEETVNKRLADFSAKHYPKSKSRKSRTNFLQPLEDIHFDARFDNYGDHVTSKTTLWTLSLIGILIIVMACINFVNLSTAQAINRSKEVGIRKVLGGKRSSLFWQMMGETAIIVFVSILIALGFAALCLPFISNVASITEKLSVLTPSVLLFLLLAGLIVTLLSGAYPALILSGFRPILALKNKITSASIGGISLRRGLVVTQFAISQALIICTIVAISQMNSVHNADLGFNKEATLIINSTSDSAIFAKQTAFKHELLSLNGVQSVAFSSDVPSSENSWSSNFAYDHRDDETFDMHLKYGDEDYFKTFGLQFVAGHGYEHSDTTRDVVVNETAIAKLGIKNPQEAIGKDIRLGRRPWRKIVGVVKDFKTHSLRETTQPVLISAGQKTYGWTSVKLKTTNLAQSRDAIQRVWDKYYPAYANRSFFMDEFVENFYQQENQLSLLYKIFSGIAILISCLGLYGLVSFMAVQRKKEVGVRKVLGASVGNIVYLFSKEFTILILIAFAIAAPIAWYLMNQWLNNFSYRINISAWIFGIAVVISVLIAWITVGYKSVKAALVNPVKSLRSE